MGIFDKIIDKNVDRFFSKRVGKYARERTKYEEEQYWAAASRNIAPITLTEHKSGKYIIINNEILARCLIIGVPYETENGYPEGLRDSMMTKLVELSNHGRQLAYSLKLVPISTIDAKKSIQEAIYVTEINADASVKKNQRENQVSIRDMDLEIAQKHNISNYQNVTENKHKNFKSSFIITMWADTESGLYATEADIKAILESEQVKYEAPDCYHKTVFLAAQPYNLPSDFAEVHLLSPYAAVLASSRNPNSRTDSEGIWFGVDKKTNKNIIIDMDKLIAPHALILGATGAGKTASTFAYIMRLIDVGYRVIYMTPKQDSGSNHRDLVEYYGDEMAALVDIGPRSHSINPLEILYDRSQMGDNVDEYIHSWNVHKEIIIQFLNVYFDDTGSVNMNARLDMSINKVYDMAGIYRDRPSTWHEGKWPVMNDLIKIFEEDLTKELDSDDRRTTKAILNKCRSMGVGGMLEFINKPTTTDFSKDLVVVDLSGVPPSIKDAMNVLIGSICAQRFRADNTRKTVICIDEAGVFLRNEKLTEMMLTGVSQGRSAGVSIWAITQQPSDLKHADGNAGDIFFTNVAIKVLLGLNLTTDNINIVGDQFKLGTAEKEALMTSGVGEGLFIIGNQKMPLRIQMTNKELDIIKGKAGKGKVETNNTTVETIINPLVNTLVNEHNFCLDSWANGFNLQGWTRNQCQNVFGAGQPGAWIKESMMDHNGHVGNQTWDHYSSVCQIAGYLMLKGINDVIVSHYDGADIQFTVNNEKYCVEYEIEGSHTEIELQEKRTRHMRDFDHVIFVCGKGYEAKLTRYLGQDSVTARGLKLKNLMEIITG